MQRPTIQQVRDAMSPLIGTQFHAPKTSNKGATGILCEKLAGIPQSSAHLDCSDGEVKTFPVTLKKDGSMVPKETVALTMLNKATLTSQECFEHSNCFKKMSRMLMVPYLRTGDTIEYLNPYFMDLSEHQDTLLPVLQKDYDDIRKTHVDGLGLTSKTGALLQNRTKGAKNTTSRAFYLKKEFMKKYVPMTRKNPPSE